jgi:hypothetical protein
MQYMLRRVLKRKEADRALWATLFVLTVLGVAVAMWVTDNAEKKRTGKTGMLAPTEFVDNPSASRRTDPLPARAIPTDTTSHPDSVTPAAATPAAATRATAAPVPATAATVVELLTTPAHPTVAAMTPACRSALSARGPWRDARAGQTWPECVDAAGNPMVVQFCTYARLASGEWVLSENNRRAPRCQAEFPLVREGKLKGIASR